MAWVNNNKKNARFNPNRRDDRLMASQVTSRREHKPRREAEPEIELVSTDPSHVLSMGVETRLDWLQMGLMQAGLGKLKVESLYKVLTNPAFGSSEGPAKKALKALVLANLHLFSGKQKKAIQEAVAAWGSSATADGRAADGESRDEDRRGRGGGGGKAGDRSSSSESRDRKRKRSSDKRKKRASRSRSRSRSKSKSRSRSKSRQRSRSRGRRRR
mmetsp:Transcript_73402/g.185102  ORF Transcript_73402/g.185102 Transcript_73402/m.185102 type:complete len:215 (+) Transcript_73402:182-826(+)